MELFKRNFFISSKDIVETFAKECSNKTWIETALIFDELIFLLKSNDLDLFKVKIISKNLNISERFVRKGINSLIDLKILDKERTKTFTYVVNTEEILKKLNVNSLQQLFISRARYVSSAIFDILKTKNGMSDIKCIKLYCLMKYMSQSNPNSKCLITYNYICKNFRCSLNTSKAYLQKLNDCKLINIIQNTEYFVTNESDIKYVDNSVDNSIKYVDNSVDKSHLHFALFDNNCQNAESAYSNNQRTNIDKEIYGFSCEKGKEKEKETLEEKILGVPSKKTPPPPLNFKKQPTDIFNHIELPKINHIIEEKEVVKVQSTTRDKKAIKKRDNKEIDILVYENLKQKNIIKCKSNLKLGLKSFEELIPYELNIIEYENFIYRLEKRCDFKFSSNFIKKLVRKLSQKYNHYKFKNLESVENYFCKAIENELLDTKLTNSMNFRYNSEVNQNRRF